MMLDDCGGGSGKGLGGFEEQSHRRVAVDCAETDAYRIGIRASTLGAHILGGGCFGAMGNEIESLDFGDELLIGTRSSGTGSSVLIHLLACG